MEVFLQASKENYESKLLKSGWRCRGTSVLYDENQLWYYYVPLPGFINWGHGPKIGYRAFFWQIPPEHKRAIFNPGSGSKTQNSHLDPGDEHFNNI